MTEGIQGAAARQLCVVVPTFNERDNVPKLLAKLDAALSGIAWEAIFVDDNSPDGTWQVVRQLAQADPRVFANGRWSFRDDNAALHTIHHLGAGQFAPAGASIVARLLDPDRGTGPRT